MTSGQRGSNSGRGGIRQSQQTPCSRCCYFHHLPTTTTTTMQARQKKRRNKSSFSIFVHVAIEAKANRLISISSLPREKVFVARIFGAKNVETKKKFIDTKNSRIDRSVNKQKKKLQKWKKKNPGSAIFRSSVFSQKFAKFLETDNGKKLRVTEKNCEICSNGGSSKRIDKTCLCPL